MNIYVLGSTGMLGTYVYDYLSGIQDVVGVSRKELDAASPDIERDLLSFGFKSRDVVINCMGLIKQRPGLTDLDFVRVNSVFPLVLADVCEVTDSKLIHITTDCVFDGAKGKYNERANHNATDSYGKSKSMGEPNKATVVRTSIIGEEKSNFLSLIEWVKSCKDSSVNGFTNHFWNGITCLQFAKVCETIINDNLFWQGVKHIHSPNTVTKYELVKLVSDVYNLNVDVRKSVTYEMCDRSLTTIRENINIDIPTIKEQLLELGEFNKQTTL